MARFADLRAQVKAKARAASMSPEDKVTKAVLTPAMLTAMADGQVDRSEISVMTRLCMTDRRFLSLNLLDILEDLHGEIRMSDAGDLIEAAAALLDADARDTAIELALRVAMADGEFDIEEQGTVMAMAKNFGIDRARYDALRALAERGPEEPIQ